MPTETEPQALLGDIYRCLREGGRLTEHEAALLADGRLTSEQQCSALSALSLRPALDGLDRIAAISLAKKNPDVSILLGAQNLLVDFDFDSSRFSLDPAWARAYAAVLGNLPAGDDVLAAIVSDIVSNCSASRLAAALLMVICVKGLRKDDIVSLTVAMAHSGAIYDYRDDSALRGARLVRRYPTGALSEKTALILPALISCARARVNVCSPFLVARSLGYTGGTWDKLSAIAGFAFPEPGDETISMLSQCGVAMTVTKANANPADRILYQLRSATGTIESGPLMVSSIASKHLCVPVHRLLLDVRYGSGAFLSSTSEASAVGGDIEEVLCANNVPTFCSFTDTLQPTGSSIGNALEVAEAIAVMDKRHASAWDERGIEEQRRIVIDLFGQLMAAEFSAFGVAEWKRFASEQFESGGVIRAFATILRTHNVPSAFVQELLDRPFDALLVNMEPVEVRSLRAGTLNHLDQRKLGEIVNRHLGAGGNQFEGEFDPKPGIVLLHRLGDRLQEHDVLCKIFADRDRAMVSWKAIQECFAVA